MRFVTIIIFIFTTFPSLANTEAFHCRGDLQLFGFDGQKIKPLNDRRSSFQFTQNEALSISAAFGSLKSYVKIFPWNGVHWVDVKNKYKAKVEFSIETDKATWFKLTAKDLSSKESGKLSCKLRN
ncbi:MAG: hypothetical protein R2827_16210 [Bdellovibrionales bacterium]